MKEISANQEPARGKYETRPNRSSRENMPKSQAKVPVLEGAGELPLLAPEQDLRTRTAAGLPGLRS
jgi:hypothetical protein